MSACMTVGWTSCSVVLTKGFHEVTEGSEMDRVMLDPALIERGAIGLLAVTGWPPKTADYAAKTWALIAESQRGELRLKAEAVLRAALEGAES
jgi:hypothetical protein